MDSPPIEGDVLIRVPYTYLDETGTAQNVLLPVYIRPGCPSSSQCSRTGMHRAVFPSVAEACYHHPDLRAHMNHSTFIVPARPAQSRPGEMRMEAESPETPGTREGSSMTSSRIGFFHDSNVTGVEGRPASEDALPASRQDSDRTPNIVQAMAQGDVPNTLSRSPSTDDGDNDTPPMDLYVEPGYHTPISRLQSPALSDSEVESPRLRSSEQSTPSEGHRIESRARSRLGSRAGRLFMKEALGKQNQLDDPEVEDPVPMRYQRPEFQLDTSELLFLNEEGEYDPIPEHGLAAPTVRKAVSSLPSASKISPSPNTKTKIETTSVRDPSSPSQAQGKIKPTVFASGTTSTTSIPSPTSPPPPYASSLSGSWEMVDVPRPNARLTVASTSSLSSATTPRVEEFTTCSCEFLGGGDWHATWCDRWVLV